MRKVEWVDMSDGVLVLTIDGRVSGCVERTDDPELPWRSTVPGYHTIAHGSLAWAERRCEHLNGIPVS